jgi:hypothetical protein
MKRRSKVLGIIFMNLFVFSFVGCGGNELKINDFSAYKNLTTSPTTIEVFYDDAYTGNFVLTDSIEIAEIVKLLFEDTIYIKGSNSPSAGGNGYMVFIDVSDSETTIRLHRITEKNKVYYPNNNTLLQKLQEIGLAKEALMPDK